MKLPWKLASIVCCLFFCRASSAIAICTPSSPAAVKSRPVPAFTGAAAWRDEGQALWKAVKGAVEGDWERGTSVWREIAQNASKLFPRCIVRARKRWPPQQHKCVRTCGFNAWFAAGSKWIHVRPNPTSARGEVGGVPACAKWGAREVVARRRGVVRRCARAARSVNMLG
jgi:hypothetical protein